MSFKLHASPNLNLASEKCPKYRRHPSPSAKIRGFNKTADNRIHPIKYFENTQSTTQKPKVFSLSQPSNNLHKAFSEMLELNIPPIPNNELEVSLKNSNLSQNSQKAIPFQKTEYKSSLQLTPQKSSSEWGLASNEGMSHVAQQPNQQRFDTTNLYITGFGANFLYEDLELLLNDFKPIMSYRIINGHTDYGIAFARLKTPEMARQAVQKLNGTWPANSRKLLRVKLANKQLPRSASFTQMDPSENLAPMGENSQPFAIGTQPNPCNYPNSQIKQPKDKMNNSNALIANNNFYKDNHQAYQSNVFKSLYKKVDPDFCSSAPDLNRSPFYQNQSDTPTYGVNMTSGKHILDKDTNMFDDSVYSEGFFEPNKIERFQTDPNFLRTIDIKDSLNYSIK